ncbi:hypothetical protein [Shewanella gaetbuli]|uniref:Uncharacterized protein n=1 Tax=Shewanella gaetbuli TaxID=220752 RepID=A0A9X2CKV1_9GAMM|nr:hypothetical protein [Shewanella gaetbuli]MCL1142010.1 hypothetical protein [Shewanella gaetbuli]
MNQKDYLKIALLVSVPLLILVLIIWDLGSFDAVVKTYLGVAILLLFYNFIIGVIFFVGERLFKLFKWCKAAWERMSVKSAD